MPAHKININTDGDISKNRWRSLSLLRYSPHGFVSFSLGGGNLKPAPSSTGSIAGKFATLPLNFALNPLLCSAAVITAHIRSCIDSNPISSIHVGIRCSASSPNPSFGGPNISACNRLQRVWIPAMLVPAFRIVIADPIHPLFKNWSLLCEVPWVIEQQLEELFLYFNHMVLQSDIFVLSWVWLNARSSFFFFPSAAWTKRRECSLF